MDQKLENLDTLTKLHVLTIGHNKIASISEIHYLRRVCLVGWWVRVPRFPLPDVVDLVCSSKIYAALS